MKAIFSCLILALLFGYSVASSASPFYIGGHLGRTTIDDDNYFNQVSSPSRFTDFTTTYSIFTGMTVTRGWNIELEIGKHETFEATSKDSSLSQKLLLENTFARVNLKQDFALANSFRWYIKESIGISKVEQTFSDSHFINPKNRTENETVFYPAIALGLQRPFEYINNKFIVYAEWQYSGYNLENDTSTYQIRYNSLGMGLQWEF